MCITCQDVKDTQLNTTDDNVERIKQIERDSGATILEDTFRIKITYTIECLILYLRDHCSWKENQS